MDNSIQQQKTTETSPNVPVPTKKSSVPRTMSLVFGAIVLVVIASGAGYFLGTQRPSQVLTQKEDVSTPPPTTATSAPVAVDTPTQAIVKQNKNEDWKTAKFGGVFSYEYPAGWHVAELWPTDSVLEQGISIIIDPSPISTAPRGGPLGTFQLTLINGLKNPDQVFQEKKAQFNSEAYTDIKTETLQSDIGTVYYYKGKIFGPMFEGEPVEKYFFTFNQNDPLNQQIVIASLELNKDPKLSEMLRHIVLSFKKL